MYNLLVPADARIADFVEKALAAGIPEESLVGILVSRGWPEKEIYDALAGHYQRVTGIEIPRRSGAAASAKDAFFYLLTFATLATWTIGFGYLAFALIDRWLADPLFNPLQSFETYTITSSMAAVIVAFPLYLLVSRAVVRELSAHPEKLESPVRKWLTYMALVIAAGVFMGDLITALTYLLRGELTSRFLAKCFVVLVLSGGVFFYYFGGLRKTEAATAGPRRDRLMAALSAAAVILVLIFGFLQLGRPSRQRDMRADEERVSDLYQLGSQIAMYRISNASGLPTTLDQLPNNVYADPITHAPYEYHPKEGSQYELCATFARASERHDPRSRQDRWAHPAGHYCFQLDATVGLQNPGIYPRDL